MSKKPPFRESSRALAKKWQQLKPLIAGARWLSTEVNGATRARFIEHSSSIEQNQFQIMTFNIQAGLNSKAYADYVKSSVSQFLPSEPNLPHITAIADLIKSYDFIGLQELDAGSYRSGHLNQLSFLAKHGSFEFWHQQLNRNFGRFGQYSNGLLSRFTPFQVEDHRLPGLPGRGAIIAKYQLSSGGHITVCCVHLALSEKARHRQLQYLKELLAVEKNLILMGDMNCLKEHLDSSPLGDLNLQSPAQQSPSYPSWGPVRSIDHILLSENLRISHTEVICSTLSDHCPVAMTITLNCHREAFL